MIYGCWLCPLTAFSFSLQTASQLQIAIICSRSISTVQRWFTRGDNHSQPTANDLHHLALMDFLLEHLEEIPKSLFELLCPPK